MDASATTRTQWDGPVTLTTLRPAPENTVLADGDVGRPYKIDAAAPPRDTHYIVMLPSDVPLRSRTQTSSDCPHPGPTRDVPNTDRNTAMNR